MTRSGFAVMLGCLVACCAGASGCGGHRHEAAVSAPVAAEGEPGPATIPWKSSYPEALGEAKAREVPLLVYTWAPWCEPCRLMERFVLASEEIGALGDGFVWLRLDTEDRSHREQFERLAPTVWPSIYIVDPCDETRIARREGVAGVDELGRFLVDAKASFERRGGCR